MITRVWHGKTSREHSANYLHFLRTEGTREYLDTNGNLSVKVWHQLKDDEAHFWTVTEWIDIDAIKTFAGQDYRNARYYPQDVGVLLEFEKQVQHYDCFDVSQAKIRNYIRQLTETNKGGTWQGESFSQKLKTVDDSIAFKAPAPGIHCVAEILAHCIHWRSMLVQQLKQEKDESENTDLNFPSIPSLVEKGWSRLKDEWESTQTLLTQQLSLRRDDFLLTQYKGGKTFEYLIEGIIQHDIYHLGQIGLVLKMIRVNTEKAKDVSL